MRVTSLLRVIAGLSLAASLAARLPLFPPPYQGRERRTCWRSSPRFSKCRLQDGGRRRCRQFQRRAWHRQDGYRRAHRQGCHRGRLYRGTRRSPHAARRRRPADRMPMAIPSACGRAITAPPVPSARSTPASTTPTNMFSSSGPRTSRRFPRFALAQKDWLTVEEVVDEIDALPAKVALILNSWFERPRLQQHASECQGVPADRLRACLGGLRADLQHQPRAHHAALHRAAGQRSQSADGQRVRPGGRACAHDHGAPGGGALLDHDHPGRDLCPGMPGMPVPAEATHDKWSRRQCGSAFRCPRSPTSPAR